MLWMTVHLWSRAGRPEDLRAYEAKALAIFRGHGGEVIAAFRPEGAGSREDIPDEVQVLRIADREAFARFLSDPERAALAPERDAVLRRTEVLLSGEPVGY